MQRKPTPQSRGANALEKRWHNWLARLPCVFTGAEPVELDHVVGSATKNNGELIGHALVIPVCHEIHAELTLNRWVNPVNGKPLDKRFYSGIFWKNYELFEFETGETFPPEVIQAVIDWGNGRSSKILRRAC